MHSSRIVLSSAAILTAALFTSGLAQEAAAPATATPLAAPTAPDTAATPAVAPAATTPAVEPAPTTPADTLAAALSTIEDSATATAANKNFSANLVRARRNLVDAGQPAVEPVLALLQNKEVVVRTNAAMVLADMARAGNASPEVMNGLGLCLKDDALAVAYWGLQGLMADAVPAAQKVAAIEATLRLDRPRPLRLLAAQLASDKRLQGALPRMIEHMKDLSQSYQAELDAGLTVLPSTVGRGVTGTGRPGTTGPGGTTGGPGGMTGGPGGMMGRPGGMTGGPGGMMGGPGGMMGGAGGMTGRPGGMMGGPGGIAGVQVKKIKLKPDQMTLSEMNVMVPIVEGKAAVSEIHTVGIACESLIQFTPEDPAFGFSASAPWDYLACVDKAGIWLEKNRDRLGVIAPVAKPEAPEAEEPADTTPEAPATEPAPSGTAAPADTSATPPAATTGAAPVAAPEGAK